MKHIADALAKSKEGRVLVVEAKKRQSARYEQIRELAHTTWVSACPSNQKGRHYRLFKAAKKELRKIALEGGESYEEMTQALRLAWVDPARFRKAVDLAVDNPVELGYHYK